MNEKISLVSIIIPSYQSAAFVTKAIDSCLAQTYKNIEIIVIDDGSTDNTKEVVSPYVTDKKIQYIYQPNKGLSGARNTGLKIAQGEYIQFLDADDTIKPEKITLQVKFLIENSVYIGVYSDYEIAKKNQIIHYQKQYPIENLFEYVCYSHFVMPIHTVLLSSKNLPYFDENLKQGEDRDFWLNIFKNPEHRFGFIHKVLATYTIHQANMTHQAHTNLFSVVYVITKHLKDASNTQKIVLENAKKYHYGLIGLHYLENLSLQDSRAYLRLSLPIRSIKYKIIFFLLWLLTFSPKLYKWLKSIAIFIRIHITHRRKSYAKN